MVDKIPVVDTAKFSAGPNDFDKNSRWKILDPTSVAEEPECEDPSLVDPTASKYSNGKKEISQIKVKKMNYDTKFERAAFSVECLQPKKCLRITLPTAEDESRQKKSTKKRKFVKPFQSKNIEYIKKPTSDELLPNIKFTRTHRLDENSHPAEWLRAFIPDIAPQKEMRGLFLKNNGAITPI